VHLRGWFRHSAGWRTSTQLLVAGAVIAVVAAAALAMRPAVDDFETSGAQPSDPSIKPAEAPSTLALLVATTHETTAPSATGTSPATTTPTTSAIADLLAVLEQIPVVLEHHDGYSRDLFLLWTDDDGDGCDTRAEVLIAESLTPAQVDPYGCTVVAGDWHSSYDDVTVTDPGELDIDHLVSLKEAWDSGAWAWTVDQRTAYANDLTDPRTLAAVTASSNRAKGDRDPSNWLPTNEADVCSYVADWIAVKARWQLSMDESEYGRIRNLLRGPCADMSIDQ